jgi:hypothetical protein
MTLVKLTRAPRLPRPAPRASADRRGVPLCRWLDQTMEHGSKDRRRFFSASRPAKRKLKPNVGRLVGNRLRLKGNSNGYRMPRVNSRGETRPLERHFRPTLTARGQQLLAENGGIPGLQRPGRRAERVSRKSVLAERARFELSVQIRGAENARGLPVPSWSLLTQSHHTASRFPYFRISVLRCFALSVRCTRRTARIEMLKNRKTEMHSLKRAPHTSCRPWSVGRHRA